MKTLTVAVMLASTASYAFGADLPLDEPCDSCNLGPYIEQQCSDDMTDVLLMSTWFNVTNERGDTIPVYGNVCVQPDEEEGDFYGGEFQGIWHDVGFTMGALGGGFAGGGGGGGGGGGLPFAVNTPHHHHLFHHVATPQPVPPSPPYPPPTPPEVPIPGTLWLFGSGLLALGTLAWRRRRA